MSESLKSIQTAIDQLNQKIESVRQETNSHFDQLEGQIRNDQTMMQQRFSDQNQQQHREIAEAFSHLSSAFGKFSAKVSDPTDSSS